MAVEHSDTLSLRTEISFPSRSILLLIFASPSLLLLSSYHGSSINVLIIVIVIDIAANIFVLLIRLFSLILSFIVNRIIIIVWAICVILFISDWSKGSSWTSKMPLSPISNRHYDCNNLIIVTVAIIIIIILLQHLYQLLTPSLFLYLIIPPVSSLFYHKEQHHSNLNLIHTLERLVMASLIFLTSWSSLASSCLTSILGGVNKSVQKP